jgi:hypothetical protein
MVIQKLGWKFCRVILKIEIFCMKKLYLICFLVSSISIYSQFSYQKEWGTYYFGPRTYCRSSIVDHEGNIITVGDIGRPYSPTGLTEPLPFYDAFTTAGVHQTSITGTRSDIYIAKFSPTGHLLWATYYGGDTGDSVSDLAVDSNNNIYIVGETISHNGIATTGSITPNYPITASPIGYLAKFSSSGILYWGTYIPCSSNSRCLTACVYISLDDSIYVGGLTRYNPTLITSGVFQEEYQDYGSGVSSRNGYIAKFDSLGSLVAGTYCGADFMILDIKSDSQNNIIAVGCTQGYTTNNPCGTAGAFQQLPHSSNEGGIFKLSSDLSTRYWSTYYGGEGSDYLYNVAVYNDDIYVSGSTQGVFGVNNNTLATTGAFQETIAGTNPTSILAKFNSSGNRVWATYFGFGSGLNGSSGIFTSSGDFINDLKIVNNKLYFTGNTNNPSGISTSGVYQENALVTSSGYIETGFIEQFDLNGARNWGTYFGGNNGDTVTNLCVIDDNEFYIAGYTYSTTGIATTGSLQPNLNVGSGTTANNMFLAKFTTPLAITSFTSTNLQLFPNPSNGNFVLEGNNNDFSDNKVLIIYDNLGREIASQDIKSGQNRVSQEFNFNTILSQGVYCAKLMEDKQVIQTFKILVK